MSHSPDDTKYIPHPIFWKGDKSISLKYIHMLLNFKGKESNILRNV